MNLEEFFKEYPKAALAYSGGVDSAYLLYAGIKYGADIAAFYVVTPFQPEFERSAAVELANKLNVNLNIIEIDTLSYDNIVKNPPNRCYYCKKAIMGAIKSAANSMGYDLLLDGTNASDDINDRPGMKALDEEGILSPLRLCGLTKDNIRALSYDAGLPTWNKPAYSCLATRILTGEEITAEKLLKVEKSEEFLFSLGFSDFRVRMREGNALLQFTRSDLPRAYSIKDAIIRELSKYFDNVAIDDREKNS